MVWLVEKRIVRHVMDMGFERVEIPVRVKFECEVVDGVAVRDTISHEFLYNRKAVHNRYPEIAMGWLEKAIRTKVKHEIVTYLAQCGFLPEGSSGSS